MTAGPSTTSPFLMKTLFLLGALLLFAATHEAQAVIRIYKLTSSSRALLSPANSITISGYLIYDTANPANSQAIEVRKNRTYSVNTRLLNVIVPSAIGLVPIDKTRDGVNDTEVALIGFSVNGVSYAGAYIGAIPRLGFRLNNSVVFQTAKSLKGTGSTTVSTQAQFENFTQSQTLTIDPLTAANPAPADTNQGVGLVTAKLAGMGFTNVQ